MMSYILCEFSDYVRDQNYIVIRQVMKDLKSGKPIPRFCNKADLYKYANDIEVMNICLEYFSPLDIELFRSDPEFVLDNYGHHVRRCAQNFLIGMLLSKQSLDNIKTFVYSPRNDFRHYRLRELIYFALKGQHSLDVIRFIFSMEGKYGKKINIHGGKILKKFNPDKVRTQFIASVPKQFSFMDLFDVATYYSRVDVMKFIIRRKSTHGVTRVRGYAYWMNYSKDIEVLKYLITFQGMKQQFELYWVRELYDGSPKSVELLYYIRNTFTKNPRDLEAFIKELNPVNPESIILDTFHDSLNKYGLVGTFKAFKSFPEFVLKLMEMDHKNELHSVVYEQETLLFIEKGKLNYQVAAYAYYKYGYHTSIEHIVSKFNRSQMQITTKTLKYMIEIYPELPLELNVFDIKDDRYYNKILLYILERHGVGSLPLNLGKIKKRFRLTYPEKTKYYELMPVEGRIRRWKRVFGVVIQTQNI